MKAAKFALVVANVMALLAVARDLLMLFLTAHDMWITQGRPVAYYHRVLYLENAALAWNLVLAGSLIFATSRFQKSN